VLRPGAAGPASLQAEESRGGSRTFSTDVSAVYCGLKIVVTSVKRGDVNDARNLLDVVGRVSTIDDFRR
jgi:hypothetical protein